MTQYYFLVASLPMLALGTPPPITMEEFQSRCQSALSSSDLSELETVLGEDLLPGKSEFSQEWYRRETQLRNAVVRVRGGRLGVEPKNYLREHSGFDVSIEKAVTDAYTKPNPMERELALDRSRWQIADEIALSQPFSLSSVLAYAVKIKIAYRWEKLSEEAGQERLKELITLNMSRWESPE